MVWLFVVGLCFGLIVYLLLVFVFVCLFVWWRWCIGVFLFCLGFGLVVFGCVGGGFLSFLCLGLFVVYVGFFCFVWWCGCVGGRLVRCVGCGLFFG